MVQDWLGAIIDSVREVTHIALPGELNDDLIGDKVKQEGVVLTQNTDGGCASVTDARYAVTTEVYPDSDRVTEMECNDAQVAAVVGALDFMINATDTIYYYYDDDYVMEKIDDT